MELHQGSLFPFCKKADLEWIDSFEWWEVCMYDPAAQPLLHNWRWSLENSPTSHVKDQRQQQRIPTWKQLEESVFLHSESISGNSAHVCVCAKLLHLCLTLWHSGPLPTRFLSCGILQARIWSGWSCPHPGDLLYQWSNPYLLCLLHCSGFFTWEISISLVHISYKYLFLPNMNF